MAVSRPHTPITAGGCSEPDNTAQRDRQKTHPTSGARVDTEDSPSRGSSAASVAALCGAIALALGHLAVRRRTACRVRCALVQPHGATRRSSMHYRGCLRSILPPSELNASGLSTLSQHEARGSFSGGHIQKALTAGYPPPISTLHQSHLSRRLDTASACRVADGRALERERGDTCITRSGSRSTQNRHCIRCPAKPIDSQESAINVEASSEHVSGTSGTMFKDEGWSWGARRLINCAPLNEGRGHY